MMILDIRPHDMKQAVLKHLEKLGYTIERGTASRRNGDLLITITVYKAERNEGLNFYVTLSANLGEPGESTAMFTPIWKQAPSYFDPTEFRLHYYEATDKGLRVMKSDMELIQSNPRFQKLAMLRSLGDLIQAWNEGWFFPTESSDPQSLVTTICKKARKSVVNLAATRKEDIVIEPDDILSPSYKKFIAAISNYRRTTFDPGMKVHSLGDFASKGESLSTTIYQAPPRSF